MCLKANICITIHLNLYSVKFLDIWLQFVQKNIGDHKKQGGRGLIYSEVMDFLEVFVDGIVT